MFFKSIVFFDPQCLQNKKLVLQNSKTLKTLEQFQYLYHFQCFFLVQICIKNDTLFFIRGKDVFCTNLWQKIYIEYIVLYPKYVPYFLSEKEILFLYHKMCTIFFCKRIICFCAACFSCKAIFYYGSNGIENVYHLAFAKKKYSFVYQKMYLCTIFLKHFTTASNQ